MSHFSRTLWSQDAWLELRPMPSYVDCRSRPSHLQRLLACYSSLCYSLCNRYILFLWANEDGCTRIVLSGIFKNAESANCPLWPSEYLTYFAYPTSISLFFCHVLWICSWCFGCWFLFSKQTGTITADAFLKSYFQWQAVQFELKNLCKEESFVCPACTPKCVGISVDGNRKLYRFKSASRYFKTSIM